MKPPLVLIALISLTLIVCLIALALLFGGPNDPPPMPSINNPFKNVDFSDMAATHRFAARDGTKLAFRPYTVAAGTARGSVVLVHGSSAGSNSMHVLAKAFAAAGYTAYALDVRGHGESGTKGYITYIG